MRKRYLLVDADTGQRVETFDPLAIALAEGDPFKARLFMALADQAFTDAKVIESALGITHKQLLAVLKAHPSIPRYWPWERRLRAHLNAFLAAYRPADRRPDEPSGVPTDKEIERVQAFLEESRQRAEQERLEHLRRKAGR
jgi:hypothetical protein